MDKDIRNVTIIVNYLKEQSSRIVDEIRSYMSGIGVETQVFGYSGTIRVSESAPTDLVFSLGGDGTALFCARAYAPYGIPIIPVNLGNFGFITEVSEDEWRHVFEKYRAGALGVSQRLMLKTEVWREGGMKSSFFGLNDIVISGKGISKLIRLSVELPDSAIGRYRADGIIVATPTGSTAYSAAAGGPLLAPEMEAVIINPICPFTLSNRPLVIPGHETIQILVDPDQRTELLLTVDGQNEFSLEPRDCLIVRPCDAKALIVRSDKRNFYEILRTKLKWSGGPDA